MIGGEGADHLIGNSDDDVLVGGLTIYDSRSSSGHEAFWCNVLQEWNSSNAFSVRVQNLRDGTGGSRHNGNSLLLPSVRNDLAVDAVDILNGSAGNDWLIFLMTEDRVMNGEATDNA
jgi:Ca2+-binding RTX toxin-like protein